MQSEESESLASREEREEGPGEENLESLVGCFAANHQSWDFYPSERVKLINYPLRITSTPHSSFPKD